MGRLAEDAVCLIKVGSLAGCAADDDDVVDAPDVGPLAATPGECELLKVECLIAEREPGHLIAAQLDPEYVVGLTRGWGFFHVNGGIADALDAPGAFCPLAIGIA